MRPVVTIVCGRLSLQSSHIWCSDVRKAGCVHQHCRGIGCCTMSHRLPPHHESCICPILASILHYLTDWPAPLQTEAAAVANFEAVESAPDQITAVHSQQQQQYAASVQAALAGAAATLGNLKPVWTSCSAGEPLHASPYARQQC